MAVQPGSQIQRAKAWLLKSGLSQRDQDLYQIINALIDAVLQAGIATEESIANIPVPSSNAIEALTDDVVAVGPGTAPATIQPNVVTYNKIQQVTALRLVGNPEGSLQDMVEIELGENLEFQDGILQITLPDSEGAPGIAHRLLSPTHIDTLPASPIEGDLIYAGPGSAFEGTYVNAVIMVDEALDLPLGIYCALYLGFETESGILAPIGGAISPHWGSQSVQEVENTWLTWDIIDAYIQVSPVIEEFGIYGSAVVSIPGSGTYLGMYAYPFTLITPPSPLPDYSTGTWRRMGIGATDEVLTVVDGIPQWQALPPIPAEPAYPWTDIPFDAADFTATGGSTPDWTVALADVERWQYQQFPGTGGVGNNVRIALYVRATSVSGSGPTQLQIALPFNIIGRFALYISIQENGAAVNNVYVEYDESSSPNTLTLQKIGGGAFDTTAAGTFLAFEISAVKAP